MHAEPLAAAADGVHVLHVGGLGAGVLLERERGLHVFEADDDTPRVTIAVDLAARPPETATARDLTAVAEERLGAAGIGERVVRRYRERDAPLVRDAARGYRTGRLDRVLAGDFDLF
jgi:ATP-dependent Clp protease ATP-binding subunit ClpC